MREPEVYRRRWSLLLLLVTTWVVADSGPAAAADPFKLGVEQKGYIEEKQPPMQGYADYPAPQFVGAPIQPKPAAKPPLQAGAATTAPAPPPRPPIQATVQKVVLPPDFMGVWNVQGQRSKVEAQPEFQAGAEQAFATSTSNIWEISGDANSGYNMGSNTGIKSPMIVDKVQGGTAFIRYQHPVGKTMAQEAIVMTLAPGGAQFNGLERITIVKPNQPPRARVTYQLFGRRQH